MKLPSVFMRGRAEARALTINAVRTLTFIDNGGYDCPIPATCVGAILLITQFNLIIGCY